MSIIHLRGVKYFLILALIIPLSACKESKNGGGVIVKTEQPQGPTSPPPFTGPFGGPILNDQPIPDPSPYLPDYNGFDLENLINQAGSGDIIELDRDVRLSSSFSINKTVKIRSKPGMRVRIFGSNLPDLASTGFSNVEFKNITFILHNVNSFMTAGNPLVTGLVLDNVTVELSGTSSFKIFMNGVTIKNSTILGYSNLLDPESRLVNLSGNNFSILANTIVDVNQTYGSALFLDQVANSVVRSNVIRCYCQLLGAPIRTFTVDNTIISGNVVHDANQGRLANSGSFEDPDLDGSFGLALQYAHFISDEGVANKFNADRFAIDDTYVPGDPNISSDISLITTAAIPAFGNNQLFNFPATKDWTPICALGTNPTLSLNPVTGWSSYVTQNNTTIYYSGSIKPACP